MNLCHDIRIDCVFVVKHIPLHRFAEHCRAKHWQQIHIPLILESNIQPAYCPIEFIPRLARNDRIHIHVHVIGIVPEKADNGIAHHFDVVISRVVFIAVNVDFGIDRELHRRNGSRYRQSFYSVVHRNKTPISGFP